MLEGKLNPTRSLTASMGNDPVLRGIITGVPSLTGFFSGVPQLAGFLHSAGTLSGVMLDSGSLSGILSVVTVTDAESYTGTYEVAPAVGSQTIPVKNKLMKQDLTVEPIPFYETSNPTGTTVYIGG